MRGRTRRLDVHGILVLAAADGDRPAGGLDRLFCEFDIGDLLDSRLLVLVDVAVLRTVFDRPLAALGVEAGIEGPDAVLGQSVDRLYDRIAQFITLFLDYRH